MKVHPLALAGLGIGAAFFGWSVGRSEARWPPTPQPAPLTDCLATISRVAKERDAHKADAAGWKARAEAADRKAGVRGETEMAPAPRPIAK